MEKRVRPLIDVNPIYERDLSVYPDTIRVPMADGQVVKYRIDVEQPHPAFHSVIELIEKLPVYGGYKAKHQK